MSISAAMRSGLFVYELRHSCGIRPQLPLPAFLLIQGELVRVAAPALVVLVRCRFRFPPRIALCDNRCWATSRARRVDLGLVSTS